MLPRDNRLRRERDIRAVYARKKTVSGSNLLLYSRIRSNSTEFTGLRFGFVISKKVSKRSHDRNRLKRRLREICRALLVSNSENSSRLDILIVAKPSSVQLEFARLVADVEALCWQAGLITSDSCRNSDRSG